MIKDVLNIKQRLNEFTVNHHYAMFYLDFLITRKGYIPQDKKENLFKIMCKNYESDCNILTIHAEPYNTIQEWFKYVYLINEGEILTYFISIYEFIEHCTRYTYIVDPTEEDVKNLTYSDKTYLI